MSKVTITSPFSNQPLEVLVCDARTDWNRHITNEHVGRSCCYSPELVEENGKTFFRQIFYLFIIDGKELHVCKECLKLWQCEPGRVSFE